MIRQLYPTEHPLNKASSFDTLVPILDMDLTITNGIVSSKYIINEMILILK